MSEIRKEKKKKIKKISSKRKLYSCSSRINRVQEDCAQTLD
jgi:hypothetical protein